MKIKLLRTVKKRDYSKRTYKPVNISYPLFLPVHRVLGLGELHSFLVGYSTTLNPAAEKIVHSS